MLVFTRLIHQIAACARSLARKMCKQEGAELIEFAISLPLLVVFVVGIYDFGSAFTLKQKLGNITFEAARIAASQPMSGLSNTGSCGAPGSICTIRDIVASDLRQNRVNDCSLGGATGAPSPSAPLTWIFTATGTCSGSLILTVGRGNLYSATLPNPPFSANTYTTDATQIKMQYPYQWQFNRVIGLLVSGANYPGNSTLTLTAVIQNLD